MKQLSLLLALLLLAASLSACGGSGNTLFDALDTTRRFTVSIYDGQTTQIAYPGTDGEALLNKLKSAHVEYAHMTTTPIPSESVIYGISGQKRDGSSFQIAFFDDRCYTQDGLTYHFDLDLSWELAAYDWTWNRLHGSAYFPCASRLLAYDDGSFRPTWQVDFLYPADVQASVPPDGVTAAFIEWDGSRLTYEITNNSGKEFPLVGATALEVSIDGVWYAVPSRADGYFDWPYTAGTLELVTLEDTRTTMRTYPVVDRYGTPACFFFGLPAGQYRLIVYGLAVEFEVK